MLSGSWSFENSLFFACPALIPSTWEKTHPRVLWLDSMDSHMESNYVNMKHWISLSPPYHLVNQSYRYYYLFPLRPCRDHISSDSIFVSAYEKSLFTHVHYNHIFFFEYILYPMLISCFCVLDISSF